MLRQTSPPSPPPPYHFCTYFDRNYLTRGLALYFSLREHCTRPFTLWTLCFDDESYAILERMALEGIHLIRRADFEAGDDELAIARANRSPVEYYWTCTPSLPIFILRQDRTIALITYLDADLFFFSDPQPIFDALGHGAILIHGHRYAPEHILFAERFGHYNVGLVSFRRDVNGLSCLHWWRSECNKWCYARAEDGRYGDQKYLDEWPMRFGGVIELAHVGAGLAPWNMEQYRITLFDGKVRVENQALIFFHFHGLRIVSQKVVSPSGGVYAFSDICLKHIVAPYMKAIGAAANKSGQSLVDPGGSKKWTSIALGLLRQDLWRFDDGLVSRLLWRIGRLRRVYRKLANSRNSSFT